MTNTYIVLWRDKDSVGGKWNLISIEGETAEQAVRDELSKSIIFNMEWVINKVTERYHSDEFHNDGTFDDLYEEEDRYCEIEEKWEE